MSAKSRYTESETEIMLGLMQNQPLLVSSLLEQAEKFHRSAEIVTRTVEGPIHRCTYADVGRRSRQLAAALTRLGVSLGDRIGTLGWNTFRHLEAWYGITGIGAITHTINPRLFEEQISYIVNHAENKFILTDTTFLPILENLQDELETVQGFIVMAERENMPETSLRDVLCYEELLEAESDVAAVERHRDRTKTATAAG